MSVADIPTGWSVTPWQISIIPDFQITLQALNENFKTDAGKEGISGQWYLWEMDPPGCLQCILMSRASEARGCE